MRVHLDSGSVILTEHKNNIFIKMGGTRKICGLNYRGTSRTLQSFTQFFLNQKFIENFKIFRKPAL